MKERRHIFASRLAVGMSYRQAAKGLQLNGSRESKRGDVQTLAAEIRAQIEHDRVKRLEAEAKAAPSVPKPAPMCSADGCPRPVTFDLYNKRYCSRHGSEALLAGIDAAGKPTPPPATPDVPDQPKPRPETFKSRQEAYEDSRYGNRTSQQVLIESCRPGAYSGVAYDQGISVGGGPIRWLSDVLRERADREADAAAMTNTQR